MHESMPRRAQRPSQRPLRYKYFNAEIDEFFAEIAEGVLPFALTGNPN